MLISYPPTEQIVSGGMGRTPAAVSPAVCDSLVQHISVITLLLTAIAINLGADLNMLFMVKVSGPAI
jgi:hypothetical protein